MAIPLPRRTIEQATWSSLPQSTLDSSGELSAQRLLNRFDAEVGIFSDRKLPPQNSTAAPVDVAPDLHTVLYVADADEKVARRTIDDNKYARSTQRVTGQCMRNLQSPKRRRKHSSCAAAPQAQADRAPKHQELFQQAQERPQPSCRKRRPKPGSWWLSSKSQ